MIYVKFDENNTSTEMRTDVPDEEKGDYVAVSDDSLFGKRLVKLKSKVREFTAKEYADEATAVDRRHKGVVIDNMARLLLRDTAYLVEPDFYEGLTVEKRAEVKAYRDALRNINEQEQYPEYVVFPDKPNL
jgi:hypothetical protein